jgi:hypothetical protein
MKSAVVLLIISIPAITEVAVGQQSLRYATKPKKLSEHLKFLGLPSFAGSDLCEGDGGKFCSSDECASSKGPS